VRHELVPVGDGDQQAAQACSQTVQVFVRRPELVPRRRRRRRRRRRLRLRPLFELLAAVAFTREAGYVAEKLTTCLLFGDPD
jgi:hypothetical protein